MLAFTKWFREEAAADEGLDEVIMLEPTMLAAPGMEAKLNGLVRGYRQLPPGPDRDKLRDALMTSLVFVSAGVLGADTLGPTSALVNMTVDSVRLTGQMDGLVEHVASGLLDLCRASSEDPDKPGYLEGLSNKVDAILKGLFDFGYG
jgi:hypothetical protein